MLLPTGDGSHGGIPVGGTELGHKTGLGAIGGHRRRTGISWKFGIASPKWLKEKRCRGVRGASDAQTLGETLAAAPKPSPARVSPAQFTENWGDSERFARKWKRGTPCRASGMAFRAPFIWLLAAKTTTPWKMSLFPALNCPRVQRGAVKRRRRRAKRRREFSPKAAPPVLTPRMMLGCGAAWRGRRDRVWGKFGCFSLSAG